MTNDSLAHSYLVKARARLRILPVLCEEQAFSDVVREAQEIVELALKGMLRQIGVEPPHWHDVGGLILEHRVRLACINATTADRLADISARLRKEREFAFYGDIDLIPTERYHRSDADQAIADAEFVVGAATTVIRHD